MPKPKTEKRASEPRSASGTAPGPEDWPASRVDLWELDRIIPYDRNPKSHPESQIDLIAASMRSDGVTSPILVDEAGVIIYGHGRRLAALKNGFKRYPVAQALGWSDEKKRAVRIKDNSFAALSPWNPELIKIELNDLKLSGYDLPLLGFPEAQLRGFGISLGMEATEPEVIPEPPKNPVSRTGDVWLMMNHRLLCGDSTKREDVARALGDAKPHLMVTDPPYGVDYNPNWRNEPEKLKSVSTTAFRGRKAAIGTVMNDHRSDWSDAWKLFPGNVAYIWHGERQSPEIAAHLGALDFDRRNLIVWVKDGLVISRGHYHPQHETCWYFVRKGTTARWAGDRKQATTWFINRNARNETGHGTQKPIECMKRPIENNSKAGDAVYEPFSGSGTTIIAAEMTNRECLALELDPGYVDVAVERWQNFTKLEAILEGTGKTFAQVKAEREKKPRATRAGRRPPALAPRPAGRAATKSARPLPAP